MTITENTFVWFWIRTYQKINWSGSLSNDSDPDPLTNIIRQQNWWGSCDSFSIAKWRKKEPGFGSIRIPNTTSMCYSNLIMQSSNSKEPVLYCTCTLPVNCVTCKFRGWWWWFRQPWLVPELVSVSFLWCPSAFSPCLPPRCGTQLSCYKWNNLLDRCMYFGSGYKFFTFRAR